MDHKELWRENVDRLSDCQLYHGVSCHSSLWSVL